MPATCLKVWTVVLAAVLAAGAARAVEANVGERAAKEWELRGVETNLKATDEERRIAEHTRKMSFDA